MDTSKIKRLHELTGGDLAAHLERVVLRTPLVAELVEAARGASRKLHIEYHLQQPDAPDVECWAEGERLAYALERLDESLG